jgi:hypothetical protein
MTKQEMYCWSCCAITEFTVEDPDEGLVCGCGHFQDSEAQGAAEICELATWHNLEQYKRVAAIARARRFTVPDYPPYVDLSDEDPLCECPSLINGHRADCAFAKAKEGR